jgi:pseudaminic acid biosynthesis-associated methylase
MITRQMEFWKGDFGAQYTDRNTFNPEELNQIYLEQYGIIREDMNHEFLSGLSINSVLEVGCNIGNQLNVMQNLGFANLYGIELQSYAVEKAKAHTKDINIIQGSAFDVPFKDAYFDLVYTFGVLIHISPDDINKAMDEIYRTSKQYIWGFEYYNDDYVRIDYRGNDEKMWKGNFAQMFLERYPNLRLVKEVKYPYVKNSNVDQMYLLEKAEQSL